MSEQLAINFDPPRARRRDPITSHVAAVRAKELARLHIGKIFEALSTPGTIYDLAERTGLDAVQIARRLPEMLDVEPTDETRASPKGRPCRVWRRRSR